MSAMMIIYLAEIAENIKITSLAILLLGGAGAPFYFGPMEGFRGKSAKTIIKVVAAVSSCLLMMAVFIPSQKTIYMMAAAKVGQDIVQAPQTKEIGDKILKVINQKLDEQLKK